MRLPASVGKATPALHTKHKYLLADGRVLPIEVRSWPVMPSSGSMSVTGLSDPPVRPCPPSLPRCMAVGVAAEA